jgi:acyl-CoA synthetase (AMP-forming)/AMP-acid ligase II
VNVTLLLEMAADGFGDRVAVGSREGGLTYADLLARAKAAGSRLAKGAPESAVLLDLNSEIVPILLFGSAIAGRPYVPVNYRLTDDRLQAILARTAPGVVVVSDETASRAGGVDGLELWDRDELLSAVAGDDLGAEPAGADPEEIAVLLFTSGTTGEPKAAVLRHRNLTSYILGTVEYMGADEDEAALVTVPPYHIAGIAAVLSSTYSGRRIFYRSAFEPVDWVQSAAEEAITHAMVVPTMLGRILDVLAARGESLPALRHLSYGGGRMPVPVIERAMEMLPHVDFVNAYGLTETSSTVAVLGPDDHRLAMYADDPAMKARLGSVGRVLPTVEIEIRDEEGQPVPAGSGGEIWIRGEQVAGEYVGRSSSLTADGWFQTNDGGRLDDEGYLFIEGRLDDVIVRGGENLSPGEIEDVLLDHPAVAEACVVGVPDQEWGEKVVAAIVLAEGASATEAELQDHVRSALRSTCRPERIDFVVELPFNEMGKLLRREVRTALADAD